MIQSILRGSLTAWLLLATATPPPATAAQQAPQAFEPAPCPRATVREFEDERRLTCGFLSVLEDRTQPNGPRIKLNVVRVKAVSPRPAEDPVIMLAGGPGEGLGDLVPLLFGEDAPLEPLLADRDWIVLDQRGTGRSQPALDCPELTNLSAPEQLTRVSDEDPTSGRVVALRLCRERLAAAGVNLSAYNTVENAADVAALRTALGIKSFNLYAESYGTRLALAIVRDHPDGLRSLILDSTYPLQAGLNPVLATNYSRALNRVFDRCDADPGCSAAYPNIRGTFEDLIARASSEPAVIDIMNFQSGEAIGVAVDGTLLMSLFFTLLYQPLGIRALPALIDSFAKGDFTALTTALSLATAVSLPISWAMHFSVQCGEDVVPGVQAATPTGDVMPQVADNFLVPEWDRQICADWPKREAGTLGRTPARSAVPTLILAGEFDPITPPSFGRLAGQSLSGSTFVEFAGVSHIALLSGGQCSIGIVRDFLRLPGGPIDAACAGVAPNAEFLIIP